MLLDLAKVSDEAASGKPAKSGLGGRKKRAKPWENLL